MSLAAIKPVIKSMILEGIKRSPVARGKNVTAIFFFWIAAVFVALGMGFLLFSEYSYLVTIYTGSIAALIVTATAFAVALACAGIGLILMKMDGHRQSSHHHNMDQPDIAKTVSSLIDTIADELEDPIKDNPKTAVMIASLAGFLAGDSSRHH